MKKISFLAAAITLALSGCGSDDSNHSNPTPTNPTPAPEPVLEQITITAIDGYLYNAEVYIGDNCDTYKGSTDQKGQLTLDLSDEIIDQKVCITAIPSETIDMTRGVVVDEFTLAAPSVPESADEPVIVSPMTNLVVKQIENAAENGTEMTQEEAEQAVVESFNTNDNVVYTSEDIFGDYVAVAEGAGEEAEKAKAVNVVGETLVDNDDVLDVEDQLSVVSDISQETSDIIADETQELSDDYSPIVHTGENGYEGIETNHRPTQAEDTNIQPVTFELGQSRNYELSALFIDADGDALMYTVDAQKEAGADITNGGTTLTVTPTQAGVYDVLIYASDEASRSYPLVLNVTATTPNTAPVLNEHNTVQSDLDTLNLTATQSVDERVSINNLFIDADNDVLTYDVTDVTGNGLSINADNESAELHIIGAPEQEGTFTFNVTANDRYHSVSTELNLNVAEAPNAIPELNEKEQQRIADELTELNLQVGIAVNSNISLDQLFTDDDVLTLTAQNTIEGVDTTIHDSTLTLTGTPESSGDANLTIFADDGANSELASFTVPVAEEDSSEPTDPVLPAPAPRFEDKHFIGGAWRMGEIGEDEFDLEMGWASLMKDQDQHYFCWKKSIDIATPEQLADLELPENKTLIIDPNSDDCWPVDIQSDGSLLGDAEVYTPVYTSENEGDYQIVYELEGGLYWLDSTQDLPFSAMLPVPSMDNTVYQSIDWDDTSGPDEVRFRSVDFTVNQQNIYSSDVTKSGTFTGRELDGYGSSQPMFWTGTWEISTSGDGKELLSYNSLNSADYEQHYMRQFNQGELRIVVGQHEEEQGVGGDTVKVDIVLESTDDALLRSINTVWDPKSTLPSPLDPKLLEGKTFYVTEYGSDNGEASLAHNIVWCDAIKFENGEYYVNQRNASNNTTCPTDADLVVEGSYTIDEASSNIKVNAGFDSTTYTVIGDATELSQGAMSVISYGERKEHFTDKAAVEARLNASSNVGNNSFGFYLPTNRDGYYQFGQVTLSLTESNATITFEKAANGDDVTCSLISDYFESFWLSSGDKADYNSTCSDKAQGSASITIPRTIYGTKGESATLYSIIGTSDNRYQESVKYSIQPNVAQTK